MNKLESFIEYTHHGLCLMVFGGMLAILIPISLPCFVVGYIFRKVRLP